MSNKDERADAGECEAKRSAPAGKLPRRKRNRLPAHCYTAGEAFLLTLCTAEKKKLFNSDNPVRAGLVENADEWPWKFGC